jgi:hypothetical protein
MPSPAAIGASRLRSLLACMLLAFLTAGCAVRLIAERDDALVEKTLQVHEQFERLLVALEEAAATENPHDGAYGNHAAAYTELLVQLRVMEARTTSVAKNGITTEQVGILRDSVAAMRDLHRANSAKNPPRELSLDLLTTLREPFVQQIRAILVLQQALDR